MALRTCIGAAVIASWGPVVVLCDVPLWGGVIGGIALGHFVGHVLLRWR